MTHSIWSCFMLKITSWLWNGTAVTLKFCLIRIRIIPNTKGRMSHKYHGKEQDVTLIPWKLFINHRWIWKLEWSLLMPWFLTSLDHQIYCCWNFNEKHVWPTWCNTVLIRHLNPQNVIKNFHFPKTSLHKCNIDVFKFTFYWHHSLNKLCS